MAWTEADLISILELNPELRALFNGFATKEDTQTQLQSLNEHKSDKNVHVTREEKAQWNGILNNLTSLKEQVEQDIQEFTRNNINEQNQTLVNHMNDTNTHVTREEKDRWNSMTDSTYEQFNRSIMTKHEEAKIYADDKVNNLKSSILNGNLIIPYVNGIRFSIGNVQPSDPQDMKDIWINTATNRIYFFNNSRWNGLQ